MSMSMSCGRATRVFLFGFSVGEPVVWCWDLWRAGCGDGGYLLLWWWWWAGLGWADVGDVMEEMVEGMGVQAVVCRW